MARGGSTLIYMTLADKGVVQTSACACITRVLATVRGDLAQESCRGLRVCIPSESPANASAAGPPGSGGPPEVIQSKVELMWLDRHRTHRRPQGPRG